MGREDFDDGEKTGYCPNTSLSGGNVVNISSEEYTDINRLGEHSYWHSISRAYDIMLLACVIWVSRVKPRSFGWEDVNHLRKKYYNSSIGIAISHLINTIAIL